MRAIRGGWRANEIHRTQFTVISIPRTRWTMIFSLASCVHANNVHRIHLLTHYVRVHGRLFATRRLVVYISHEFLMTHLVASSRRDTHRPGSCLLAFFVLLVVDCFSIQRFSPAFLPIPRGNSRRVRFNVSPRRSFTIGRLVREDFARRREDAYRSSP